MAGILKFIIYCFGPNIPIVVNTNINLHDGPGSVVYDQTIPELAGVLLIVALFLTFKSIELFCKFLNYDTDETRKNLRSAMSYRIFSLIFAAVIISAVTGYAAGNEGILVARIKSNEFF